MAKLAGDPRVNQYTATALQTTFTYDFEISEDTEISVQQNYVTLTLTSEYIVTGAGDSAGGTIVLITGAALNDVITISGNTIVQRDTTFTAGGDFAAAAINAEFDRVDDLVSEIITTLGQTATLAIYSETFSPLIPTAVASKGLKVNAAGTGFEMSTYDPDVVAAAAAADLVLTNADVVSTNADVVSTNADVVLTNADVVSTNADAAQTALDAIATAADRVQTGLDADATAADVVSTNADVVSTNADVVSTNADATQTALDAIATAADAVSTAADAVATAADRVQTGSDASDASDYADAAAASAASVDFSGIDADMIPDADSTRDLGSSAKSWAEAYVDDITCSTVNGTAPLHVPSGTAKYEYITDAAGGSISAITWTTRPISTEINNSITGMSLSTNLITFPAGTFFISGFIAVHNVQATAVRLYDSTGAATLFQASVGRTDGTTDVQDNLNFSGIVTLTSSTALALQQFSTQAQATTGMGNDIGSDNIYLEIQIWRIA